MIKSAARFIQYSHWTDRLENMYYWRCVSAARTRQKDAVIGSRDFLKGGNIYAFIAPIR